MKTLVIGLGNPILGDDGVGWKVIEQLHHAARNTQYDADCLSVGGLTLMERLVGYDRAVIVDAIQTGRNPIGTVSRFRLEELPIRTSGHTASTHDTDLMSALQVGRSSGAILPAEILVVGIEAKNVYDFTEELTPPIAAAIPLAVQVVLDILEEKR
jgi:hydrogenase maturation protease